MTAVERLRHQFSERRVELVDRTRETSATNDHATIGAVTGLVGALGGIGGFLLPTLLGAVRQSTGSFGPGFCALALAASIAAVCLRQLVSPRGKWAPAAFPMAAE